MLNLMGVLSTVKKDTKVFNGWLYPIDSLNLDDDL
jgi:hypothetical protein